MKKIVVLGLVIVGGVVLAFVFRGVLTGEEVATEAECFVFDIENAQIEKYRKFCGTKVVIPKEIDGVVVESIRSQAFRDSDLVRVSIPETLTRIGTGAFYGNEITEVVLREGLEEIRPYAFYDNKIESLEIPSTVTSIGVAAFNINNIRESEAFIYFRNHEGEVNDKMLIGYGGSEMDVVIPEQVEIIYFNALSELGIESIVLPEGLQRIEFSAFAENELTKAIIPRSVVYIGNNAFDNNPIYTITIEGKINQEDFNFLGENWHGGALVKFD